MILRESQLVFYEITSFFLTKIKLMTGKEFAERIDFLLKKRKQSRKALTTDLHISSSTMSSWAAGRGSIPNANVVAQIAKYLNVSTDWLITGQEKKEEKLSADERNMLEAYRLLDKKDRQELKAIAELKLSLNMSRLGVEAQEEPSA